MKAINIFLSFMLFSVLVLAQDSIPKVFSYNDFIERVKAHHPLFAVNELQNEVNRSTINSARGSFDPKLKFNRQNKSFEGVEYYDLINAGLDIPTWFGGAIGGGFDNNEGSYLNPENRSPVGGQLYAFISQPVAKGLLWDKRRSALRKAENYAKLNEADQILMANQLLFEASNSYWEWFEAYHAKKALEINFSLGKDRLEIIKQRVLYGDRPPVDSVEATIQKDLREIAYQKGVLRELNAKQKLSSYLWTYERIPVDVAKETEPQSLLSTFSDAKSINNMVAQIPVDHPIYTQNNAKLALIRLDKRMALENLKPQIDIVYKPLNQATGNFAENYSTSNYNLGLNMSVPIFFRKGRNDLKIANRQREQTNLNFQQKQNDLRIKLIQVSNKLDTERALVVQFDELVKQYLIIVDAERSLLNEGESSLFLLNRRESNLIKSQLKYYESLGKCLKLKAERANILAQERP